MGELERGDVEVVGAELDELSAVALGEADKTRRRNVEIIQDYAARPKTGKPITVRFRFLASPVELLGDEARPRPRREDREQRDRRARRRLARRPRHRDVRGDPGPARVPLDRLHRASRSATFPFDERRGLIRNEAGRVTDADGTHQVGEYVSGWIKRGPSGVIGTNKKDSQDTVDKILEDAAAGRLDEPVADDIEEMIATQCPDAVTWDGWQAIDAIETAAGEASTPGRPRVKLTEWAALREAAKRLESIQARR